MESHTPFDNTYDRCGVYIDLSSYIYGRLVKSLENTELYERMTYSVENTDSTKKVVCELDKGTIYRIVEDCIETLVGKLAPLLLKAYRVYLAYDTFQPKAKFYEQTRRRKRMHFSLSSTSREACYNDIARKVKEFIMEAHLKTAKEHENQPTDHDDIRRSIECKLSLNCATDFAVGEGEWKCFYRMYQDITDGAVDVCYVFGRDWDIGLAMTMYQHPKFPKAIKYVYGPNNLFEHTKLFDVKERMLHFVCLALFGNDYIGGVVNLSSNNAALMKKELEKMYSGDAGACTLKQVEHLSNTLFTNESLTLTAEVENNADKRKNFSMAFATVVTRLLASIYGNGHDLHPDMVEGVLHYADIGPFTTCLGPNEEALKLRKYLADRRSKNEQNEQNGTRETTKETYNTAATKANITPDENTMLTCRDANGNQVMRSLQQCMDSLALSILWYLSYTTFYFRSPSGRKKMLKMEHTDDLSLAVGMCMGLEGTFRYNDRRLSHRFDLCRLLELKRTLQNINCCRLYWIIEGAFDNAFSSVFTSK